MPRLIIPVSAEDHRRGPDDSPVQLVEYGDFECPYCAAAHPLVQRLLQKFPEMLFVYRHFPLSEIHPLALPAAYAAEAADRQGKFWEMHDMLFENHDRLSEDAFFAFAETLDLDMAAFEEDINDPSVAERVQEQFIGGVRSGVNGTPTFFINGQRYNGPLNERILESTLHELAPI